MRSHHHSVNVSPKVSGLILIGIGIIFLLVGFGMMKGSSISLTKCSLEKASITKVIECHQNKHTTRKNGKTKTEYSTVCQVDYTYSHNNQNYSDSKTTGESSVGDTFRILVDDDNPNVHIPLGDVLSYILFAFFGLIAIMSGVVFLVKKNDSQTE